jgi:hypothetical protein
VYLLVFHAYINEIHGSKSKIPSKKFRQAALRCIKELKVRVIVSSVLAEM